MEEKRRNSMLMLNLRDERKYIKKLSVWTIFERENGIGGWNYE